MMNKGKRDIPEAEKAHKGQRTCGLEGWSEREREVLGGEETERIERDREK